MTERAYTVREIDSLRLACARRYLSGVSVQENSYNGYEAQKVIEERLRTYMLAGLVAKDFEEEPEPGNVGRQGENIARKN